jgi:hypothetical protein
MPLFKLLKREVEKDLEEVPPATAQRNVVYIGGRPYEIIAVHGHTLVVKDLATGEVKTIARPPTP